MVILEASDNMYHNNDKHLNAYPCQRLSDQGCNLPRCEHVPAGSLSGARLPNMAEANAQPNAWVSWAVVVNIIPLQVRRVGVYLPSSLRTIDGATWQRQHETKRTICGKPIRMVAQDCLVTSLTCHLCVYDTVSKFLLSTHMVSITALLRIHN
jgi:hypothetical protein